ncbi:LacI family DNA-binding transcriptional regulator [Lacticaseibacillus zhaodongensis]|uniref:LacI family DNA-binding transcriptional regulator n=1 Tax=Lacticaseibacillus zhaodongensis TaxID=2668065 RepID=UPI0012D2F38F|nr:LacI family DNA-binding transcriptional regulator [Lacticaseibacillus zhaodongensis]
MKPKLQDVAKIANVSPTTVSRVINNYGHISEKTRTRVHEAMAQLNYQPNSLARSLQGKSSHLIGLIFFDISHPFFGELVARLENLLFEQGYKTILCNSANNPEKEREYINMLAANQVDGIIAGAHNTDIKEYQESELPIISFDRFLSKTIPIVSSDNFAGGKLAAKALYDAGVRHPAMITGVQSANSPTNNRVLGFKSGLKPFDIAPEVIELPFESVPALKQERLTDIVKSKKYDGIFCSDDLTALQVKNAAQSTGIAIPDDLKLIGYDGTKLIQDYNPDLTTVVQPITEISQLLIELLLTKIKNPEYPLKSDYTLPVRLSNGSTV